MDKKTRPKIFRFLSFLIFFALFIFASSQGAQAICGDGILNAGETCDDGPNNGQPRGFTFTDASVRKIGNYSGATGALKVAVSGNYAYVANRSGALLIINIADPKNPTYVSKYVTGGQTNGVAISGNYAYVVNSTGGLYIINITSPASPTLAGFLSLTGDKYDVTIDGAYAYVASGTAGLHKINISSPASPALVGTLDTAGDAMDVTVSSGYAYVAGYLSGLQIINTSSMSLVSTFPTAGPASGVYLAGNKVYAAEETAGVQIISVASPASPTLLGAYNTDGLAYEVFVQTDYAYIADGTGGVVALKITDPVNPIFIVKFTEQANIFGLTVANNNYLYTANYTGGLDIINIAKLAPIVLNGSYLPSGSATDVYVSGQYAYVSEDTGGLQIIDVSNPALPSLKGAIDTFGQSKAVVVRGTLAYMADGNAGLQIINVANPASPTLVKLYNTPNTAYGVYVSGDYAYVADGPGGLQIIKVSDPLNPILVGTYAASDARDVSVFGRYAYVAGGGNGLQIIDVFNPANPSLIATLDTPGVANRLAVSGNYAYLADYFDLKIINISNPASPALVSTYKETSGYVIGVTLSGNYAYLAHGTSGIIIVNVFNPTNPVYVNGYNTVGAASDSYISGEWLYLADSTGGLQTFRVKLSGGGTNYCNATCSGYTASICGNAFAESGEQCDESPYNTDSQCIAGYGASCNTCNTACTIKTWPGPKCGDNKYDAPTTVFGSLEVCDGSDLNGKSCASEGFSGGTISCGASCSSFNTSACFTCGDGVVNSPYELCDGNTNTCTTAGGYPGSQNCNVSCTAWNTCASSLSCGDGACNGSENVSTCPSDCSVCGDGLCTGPETLAACPADCSVCGDGFVTGAELCDDGGAINGDGCNSSCLVESGWACSGAPSSCAKLCGNGALDAGEACDDGNTTNGDYCSSSCTVTGWCGDGVTQINELCDGASRSCTSGGYAGKEICSGSCQSFNTCSPMESCGDNKVNGPEVCDKGANNEKLNCAYGETSCNTCVSSCSVIGSGITSYCGDDKWDSSYEVCDYSEGCDVCAAVKEGYSCGPYGAGGAYACVYHCGNNVVDSAFGEQCDKGLDNGIKCVPSDYGVPCAWCDTSCKTKTVTGDYCGDGFINAGFEVCDDGNTASGDGCSNTCVTESGYTCSGSVYSICTNVCGDGVCAIGKESCVSCFKDCGICPIGTILTAPAHETGVISGILQSVINLFPTPSLRINIPGVRLNSPQTRPVEEKEVSVPNKFGAESKTPFFIGGKKYNITLESEVDGKLKFIFE